MAKTKLTLEHGSIEVTGGLDVGQEQRLPYCGNKRLRPECPKDKLEMCDDDADDDDDDDENGGGGGDHDNDE